MITKATTSHSPESVATILAGPDLIANGYSPEQIAATVAEWTTVTANVRPQTEADLLGDFAEPNACVAAMLPEGVVAYAALRRLTNTHYEVGTVIQRPQAGLGKAIMEALLNIAAVRARELGSTILVSLRTVTDSRAHNLFSTLGFIRDDALSMLTPYSEREQREDKVVMSMVIEPGEST